MNANAIPINTSERVGKQMNGFGAIKLGSGRRRQSNCERWMEASGDVISGGLRWIP